MTRYAPLCSTFAHRMKIYCFYLFFMSLSFSLVCFRMYSFVAESVSNFLHSLALISNRDRHHAGNHKFRCCAKPANRTIRNTCPKRVDGPPTSTSRHRGLPACAIKWICSNTAKRYVSLF